MPEKTIVGANPSVGQTNVRTAPIPRRMKPATGDTQPALVHSSLARLTGGLSPVALGAAYLDWATHLAFSPGKQMPLVDKAVRASLRWMSQVQSQGLVGSVPPLHHHALVSGPSLRRRRLAAMAVQSDPPTLPAQPPMVAECHHRRWRRHSAAPSRRGVRHAPASSRYALAVEFPGDDVAVAPGEVIYRNQSVDLGRTQINRETHMISRLRYGAAIIILLSATSLAMAAGNVTSGKDIVGSWALVSADAFGRTPVP